ncbi:MAG: hypothetical protein C4541_02505 [Candidatus Auribacter fodinae]|uniref:Flagellar assembly protein FliH n=1 Tax=Candidatus Auribacter fodinae TaxID=2093366 RepID=A0A3A4R898_9BACT|nr:MAG: hypothetical protein C4541_02505 [Candidatus Auribacter fodinae]
MSKVIKLAKPVNHIANVSDKVISYMSDPELKKVINEQIDRARHQAYQEGYARGSHEARDKEQKRFAGATSLISTVTDQMNSYIDSLHKEIEREIVLLISSLCESVIRRELSCPKELSAVIVDSVKKLGEQKRGIILHLHPNAAHYFEKIIAELQKQSVDLTQLHVEIDQSVGDGGCLIQTDTSVIDARVDNILRETRQKIEELIRWELPPAPQQ